MIDCDDSGFIDEKHFQFWLTERIIPSTRINIEKHLLEMGLERYDQLEILKYTKGRSIRDSVYIDFSEDRKSWSEIYGES